MKPKAPAIPIAEPDGNYGVTAAFVGGVAVVLVVVELLLVSATTTTT
jgi:hypothetical protein